MAAIKALAKSFALGAVLYLCFLYLGGFSSRQSIVLAVLALWVDWWGHGLYEKLHASSRVEKVFEPFCVSICPNWYQLLSDFKLIRSMEEWHRLREEAEKVPTSEHSVFRSGFLFTVIRPPSENGLLPGLTYWNDRRVFLSAVELLESIIEMNDDYLPSGGEEQHPLFKHPRWARLPELYFKPGIGGYELGLEVQNDWWKHLCENGEIGELAKTEQHDNQLCGVTRLVIATLPCSEFDWYYGKAPSIVDLKKRQRWEQARDKELAANGWKRKVQTDPEFKIRDRWSHAEHKYFSVSHRGL